MAKRKKACKPAPESMLNAGARAADISPEAMDAAIREAELEAGWSHLKKELLGKEDHFTEVVEVPALSAVTDDTDLKDLPWDDAVREPLPDDLPPEIGITREEIEDLREFFDDVVKDELDDFPSIESVTLENLDFFRTPPKDPEFVPPAPGDYSYRNNILIRTDYRLEKKRFFQGSRLMIWWKRLAYALGETLQSGRPVMPWRDFRDLMTFNGIYRHSSAITTLQIERQLDDLLTLWEKIPEQDRSLGRIKELAEAAPGPARDFWYAFGNHVNDWAYTIYHYQLGQVPILSHNTRLPRWLEMLFDPRQKDIVIARGPDGSVLVREAGQSWIEVGGKRIFDPRTTYEPMGELEGIHGVLEHLAAIARNAVMEQATSQYFTDRRINPAVKAVRVGAQEVLLPANLADQVAKHNTDLGVERWIQSTLPWQIDSALTTFSITGDLSALFNQIGALLALRPKRFAEIAFFGFLDAASNREGMRKLHARVIENLGKELSRRGIREDPESYLISLGLSRTGIGEDLAGMGILYRVPVAGRFFRNTNIAFSDIVYAARLSLMEDVLKAARGIEDNDEWKRTIHNFIQSVNDLTGTTNLRTTSLEKLTFLASRLVRSQIATPFLSLVPGPRGMMARRLLLKQGIATAVLTYLWNRLQGEETNFDPGKPNWLTMRDVFGNDIRLVPWMSIIPALWKTAAEESPEPLARWALWKARPTLRTTVFAIRQEDAGGYRFPGLDDPEIVQQYLLNYVPLSVRPIYEDRPGATGLDLKGRLVETLASGLGVQASPLTISERLAAKRDEVAKDRFGTTYDELTANGRAIVNRHPDVARLITERKQMATRKADTYEAERARRSLEFDERLKTIEQWVAKGRRPDGTLYTKRDAREAINEAYEQLLSDVKGNDPVLTGYFALRELARLGDGTVDYELLEQLRAEYRLEHPSLEKKLEEIQGQYDTPLLAEYRRARDLARQYYNIPPFKDMDLETGTIARRTLALADATVRAGQARNRTHALDLLVEHAIISAEERAAAILAVQNGPNPARKEFAKANPLFAEWYLGAVEKPGRSIIALSGRGPISPSQKRDRRSDPIAKALRLGGR